MLTSRALSSTLDRMMTLNRALDQAFTPEWTTQSARVLVPALDVVEKKDSYLVFVELPGVAQSELEINFEQNVLTIRGAKRSLIDSNAHGELRVYAAERTTGTFERSIRLPEYVDGDHIAAEFTNGLLTVTVPKAKAAQPRRIEIKLSSNENAQIASTSNGAEQVSSN
jgi:HSP20 family protein